MWQPLPMMKWHLSHLHWHISNQDNDRHGPHTDTGLVRIHFLPHANIDIKKVLFLHTQTTEKKPALLGLYLNEVQWRPRLKCQNWSYVSAACQGGFLCVLVLCVFPGYVWKLYVMLPEPLFHNLILTNPATVMRKKNTLKNPVIQYF